MIGTVLLYLQAVFMAFRAIGYLSLSFSVWGSSPCILFIAFIDVNDVNLMSLLMILRFLLPLL